jgi:hypothetical protein
MDDADITERKQCSMGHDEDDARFACQIRKRKAWKGGKREAERDGSGDLRGST